MAFAEKTDVPVTNTISEIGRTVKKYRGEQYLYAVMDERIIVGFTKEGRQVRFQVEQDPKNAQKCRQRARALLLVLKAKLEAVESGVSVFEDEFLANIVMPDGKLVGQHVKPRLIAAYENPTDDMALLPDYSGQ